MPQALVVRNSVWNAGRMGYITLKTEKSALNCLAGQFYMLKISDGESSDPLLARPFAPYDISRDKISFLYSIVGRGTAMLSKRRKGASLNISLPLGNGFTTISPKNVKLALVAGGIGLAPMRYLARQLTRKADITLYYGANSEAGIFTPFLKEKPVFKKVITTLDGSFGKRGFITEFFEQDAALFNRVYACGPEGMTDKLLEICAKRHITAEISKEQTMACGIGVCGGCLVKVKDTLKRCCAEGPVFTFAG